MDENIYKRYKEMYLETNDKKKYFENVFSELMRAKKINYPIKNSVIKNVIINDSGMIIELDEEHENIKLYVNDTDCEEVPISMFCFGSYEEREINILIKLLKHYKKNNEFTVFDVGANIGIYSLSILKYFSNAKVYSFEPVLDTYNRLVNNFRLNNLNEKLIYNIGFYKENKEMNFYYDVNSSGASSLVNLRNTNSTKEISVCMRKLDDFVEENDIKEIDFIKCDVEGAELMVFEGGKNIIQKSKPIIFSEMLRKWSAKFGYHPNDIINFMKQLGYKCFVISNDKLKEFTYVDEKTIETNYYFMHEIKHKDLINTMCE